MTDGIDACQFFSNLIMKIPFHRRRSSLLRRRCKNVNLSFRSEHHKDASCFRCFGCGIGIPRNTLFRNRIGHSKQSQKCQRHLDKYDVSMVAVLCNRCSFLRSFFFRIAYHVDVPQCDYQYMAINFHIDRIDALIVGLEFILFVFHSFFEYQQCYVIM